MDPERAYEIYKDRFSDASDFTFLFVGNFTPESLEPLTTTWLASLPNQERKEQARDIGDDKATGKIRVNINKGLEPKSSVRLTLHGLAPWSPEEHLTLITTIDVLQIRLRELLREDKGGVYGVSIYGEFNRWPQGNYSSSVSFGCDPDQVEDLIQIAMSVFEELKNDGPSEDVFGKVIETSLRDYERGLKENSFWLTTLNPTLPETIFLWI